MKESLFTVPNFRYELKDWAFKKKSLLRRLKPELFERDDRDFYFSDRGPNKNSYIHYLNDLLAHELDIFQKESNCPCIITDAWTVKYNKGDHQTVHHHRSWGFSAILYVEFDSKYHEPTYFLCPWSIPEEDLTFIGTPEVNEGTLFIFPSCIHHFATPNKSNKQRIILSFDLLPQSHYK